MLVADILLAPSLPRIPGFHGESRQGHLDDVEGLVKNACVIA
jgi:hypothetical protein